MRERKRLIRLLVTDVTLIRGNEQITAHVRLSGSQQHTLTIPRPLRAWEAHTTPPATIALIDQLLDEHTYDETVEILNDKGLTGGWGHPFTVVSLTQLCRNRRHSLPPPATPSRGHDDTRRDRPAVRSDHPDDQDLATPRAHHRPRIDSRRAHLYHPGQTRPPDGRRRHQPPASQAIAADRHHHPRPVAAGTTTTTPPAGTVERHSSLTPSSIAASTPAW